MRGNFSYGGQTIYLLDFSELYTTLKGEGKALSSVHGLQSTCCAGQRKLSVDDNLLLEYGQKV